MDAGGGEEGSREEGEEKDEEKLHCDVGGFWMDASASAFRCLSFMWCVEVRSLERIRGANEDVETNAACSGCFQSARSRADG